ncbi:TetR/AcrR family transcriptional regulator [Alloalcanivorax venustensis]|nr:TetR/AcrR family transcriptional regulator [Alloalcanivorax venustensis]
MIEQEIQLMAYPTRPFQGQSAASRIHARRQQLLSQAYQIIAAEGWRKLTIHKLCAQAGLNKRYFYESFDSLDAMAAALVDDLAEELIGIGQNAALSGWQEGMDTPALARQVLDRCIGWMVDEPARTRLLFSSASENPQALEQRKTVIRKMARVLSTFSLQYHQAGEPLPIAHVGSALLVGGTIEAVMSWLDADVVVSREEFVEDIACFWVAVGDSAVSLSQSRGIGRALDAPGTGDPWPSGGG